MAVDEKVQPITKLTDDRGGQYRKKGAPPSAVPWSDTSSLSEWQKNSSLLSCLFRSVCLLLLLSFVSIAPAMPFLAPSFVFFSFLALANSTHAQGILLLYIYLCFFCYCVLLFVCFSCSRAEMRMRDPLGSFCSTWLELFNIPFPFLMYPKVFHQAGTYRCKQMVCRHP